MVVPFLFVPENGMLSVASLLENRLIVPVVEALGYQFFKPVLRSRDQKSGPYASGKTTGA